MDKAGAGATGAARSVTARYGNRERVLACMVCGVARTLQSVRYSGTTKKERFQIKNQLLSFDYSNACL
jgi:hypothetical protein